VLLTGGSIIAVLQAMTFLSAWPVPKQINWIIVALTFIIASFMAWRTEKQCTVSAEAAAAQHRKRLGRPEVSLEYRMNSMPVDTPDGTTFMVLLNGSGRDAHNCSIRDVEIGGYTIKWEVIPRVPARTEWPIGCSFIRSEGGLDRSFRGDIVLFLRQMLQRTGEDTLEIKVVVSYHDFHGTLYETPEHMIFEKYGDKVRCELPWKG
jgi:hypothetical protein